MTTAALTQQLDRRLGRLLDDNHIERFQPRDRMLQLNALPVGPPFNKQGTNLLLRERAADQGWQMFVDEDLAYQGENAARRAVFSGTSRRGWRELVSPAPILGDVNAALVWALAQLESAIEVVPSGVAADPLSAADHPLAAAATRRQPANVTETVPPGVAAGANTLDPVLQRVGRLLDLSKLVPVGFEPTSAQADAIRRAAETVTRGNAPTCPVLMGAAGTGKSLVGRLAAHELLSRGVISRVLQINGAAVSSGAIFWPERDERLRVTIEALADATDTLVLWEQFDLAFMKSETAPELLADGLDRGLRMIAIGRPEFRLRSLRGAAALRRRLEPTVIGQPSADEVLRIVRQRSTEYAAGGQLEIAPLVPPLVAQMSRRRPGGNPGAALGLLEAALHRAAFAGQCCVGPDDVYHLIPRRTER